MADTPQIAAVTKSISVLESTNEIPDYVTPLDTAVLKTKPVLPVIDYTNLDFSSIILSSNILVYRARKSMRTHFRGLLTLLFQQLSYHHDSCFSP